MKFFILFIYSFLTFVAATPLVPRAPSKPFQIAPKTDTRLRTLQLKPVAGTEFFIFGWFRPTEITAELYFPSDPSIPGLVLDQRNNQYQMSLQPVSGLNGMYQLMLGPSAQSATGLTNRFSVTVTTLDWEVPEDSTADWFFCEKDLGVFEVFFGSFEPRICRLSVPISLHPQGPGWGWQD